MTRILIVALISVSLFSGFAFANDAQVPTGTDETVQQIKAESAPDQATATEEAQMEVVQNEEKPADAEEQKHAEPETE
jgi:hypothetical protein